MMNLFTVLVCIFVLCISSDALPAPPAHMPHLMHSNIPLEPIGATTGAFTGPGMPLLSPIELNAIMEAQSMGPYQSSFASEPGPSMGHFSPGFLSNFGEESGNGFSNSHDFYEAPMHTEPFPNESDNKEESDNDPRGAYHKDMQGPVDNRRQRHNDYKEEDMMYNDKESDGFRDERPRTNSFHDEPDDDTGYMHSGTFYHDSERIKTHSERAEPNSYTSDTAYRNEPSDNESKDDDDRRPSGPYNDYQSDIDKSSEPKRSKPSAYGSSPEYSRKQRSNENTRTYSDNKRDENREANNNDESSRYNSNEEDDNFESRQANQPTYHPYEQESSYSSEDNYHKQNLPVPMEYTPAAFNRQPYGQLFNSLDSSSSSSSPSSASTSSALQQTSPSYPVGISKDYSDYKSAFYSDII